MFYVVECDQCSCCFAPVPDTEAGRRRLWQYIMHWRTFGLTIVRVDQITINKRGTCKHYLAK